MITAEGFTSLPTRGGVWFFGFYSNKQTSASHRWFATGIFQGVWIRPQGGRRSEDFRGLYQQTNNKQNVRYKLIVNGSSGFLQTNRCGRKFDTVKFLGFYIARSRENETRNALQNANRNPRWSEFRPNEPFEKKPVMTIKDFVLHSDDHFESQRRLTLLCILKADQALRVLDFKLIFTYSL